MEIANKAEEAHITKPRIDVPPYTLSTNVDQETCMAMSATTTTKPTLETAQISYVGTMTQ